MLECVDIIFLGQFDVPEHVFNIGSIVRPLLEAYDYSENIFHIPKGHKMTLFMPQSAYLGTNKHIEA